MSTNQTRYKDHTKKFLLFLFAIFVIICGMLIFMDLNAIQAGLIYDPKQAAQDTVVQCLAGSREFCGYLTDSPCWAAMQQSAEQSANEYTIDVLWYNWEDQICCRGGDEVYMQVNFSNGNTFRVLWYEESLESCEVVAIATNLHFAHGY